MSKKKMIVILSIVALLVIIGIIVYFTMIKPNHQPTLVDKNGSTISTGKQDLIQHLKETENAESRKDQIDFAVEQNLMTQEEANELY